MDLGSILGGKTAGTLRWPPTVSRAEVKGRVDLYVYSPSGPSWPVIGWTERSSTDWYIFIYSGEPQLELRHGALSSWIVFSVRSDKWCDSTPVVYYGKFLPDPFQFIIRKISLPTCIEYSRLSSS
jgi:hypothetical protein